MRFLSIIFALAVAGLPTASASSWHAPRSVAPRDSSSGTSKMFKRETNGIIYNVYEHAATNATLEIVENSGICETTPGVNTYSGYLSVGTNSEYRWLFCYIPPIFVGSGMSQNV